MSSTINHIFSLQENLIKIFSASIHPEVTLICQDKKFAVHRIILGSQSKVFSKILYVDEANKTEIKIDAPVEAFEIFLEYFYSGTMNLVNKSIEIIVEVFLLALRFKLPELEKSLMDIIILQANVENVNLMYVLAKLLKSQKLFELCRKVIKGDINGFLDQKIYCSWSKRRLIRDLMYTEDIELTAMEKFEIAYEWLKANKWHGKRVVLSFVEPHKLSNRQLLKVVASTNIYKKNYLFDIMKQRDEEVHDELDTNRMRVVVGYLSPISGPNDHELILAQKYKNIDEIVIDLGRVREINCVKFKFCEQNFFLQEYSIQTTLMSFYPDNLDPNLFKWTTQKSYKYCKRSQKIYFPNVRTRFVRIQGTGHICSFHVKKLPSLPELFNGFLCPKTNICNIEDAYVHDKLNDISQSALCWDFIETGMLTKYTEGYTFFICLNQPCFLKACMFRLWDFDDQTQSFRIQAYDEEVKMVYEEYFVDVKGWQMLKFPPRVYSFFLFDMACGNKIKIVHFEAYA